MEELAGGAEASSLLSKGFNAVDKALNKADDQNQKAGSPLGVFPQFHLAKAGTLRARADARLNELDGRITRLEDANREIKIQKRDALQQRMQAGRQKLLDWMATHDPSFRKSDSVGGE
jgi:hypothetical protein